MFHHVIESAVICVLVQVLCRSLIMWNSVTPSEAWINSNLPHVSSCCLFIFCPLCYFCRNLVHFLLLKWLALFNVFLSFTSVGRDENGQMDVCKGLRERLGLVDIISVLQQNKLQWYGHVLWKEDNDWVKKCMEYDVDGARPGGRSKKTWSEVVQKDCQAHKLNRVDAMDCNRWRKQIRDDWWPW